MHSFMSFTKWLFLGSFLLQGVFSSNFGRFIFCFHRFFRTGDGVWKFALNMCILGFSFFSLSLLILYAQPLQSVGKFVDFGERCTVR